MLVLGLIPAILEQNGQFCSKSDEKRLKVAKSDEKWLKVAINLFITSRKGRPKALR